MIPFFEPLTPMDLALLLTAFHHDPEDALGLLSGLPHASKDKVLAKAKALLELEGKARQSLVAHSLAFMLEQNALHRAEYVDPSQLAECLETEHPQVIGSVLQFLPNGVAQAVMRQWSDDVQSTITSYKQRKPANLLLCTLIRQIFEIRFPLMFVGKNEQQRFGIQQLFLLEREEILALVYDIGLVQLGYSFFVWGEESVTELCRKLPRHEAEELIASLKIAVQVLIKDRPQAQFFISHILKDFDNIDDLIYSAGLWHLSVALLPASAIDYDRLRLRLPKPLANTFQSYQSIASSHKSLYNEEHLHAQQDHILLRVMILEQCGAIALQKNNKITLPVCFFHEEAILNILKMHTSKKETQLSREDKDSYGKTD